MADLDFVYRCGDATLMALQPDGSIERFMVHPSLIQDACPLLALSFEDGPNGAGQQATIEASSAAVVTAFLRFIYTGSYCMDTEIGAQYSLLRLAELFKLALNYDVPELQSMLILDWTKEFETAGYAQEPPPELCEAIRFVYKTFPQQALFTEAVLHYCVYSFKHHHLDTNAEFRRTAFEVPEFHKGLCQTNFRRNFQDDGAKEIMSLPVCRSNPPAYHYFYASTETRTLAEMHFRDMFDYLENAGSDSEREEILEIALPTLKRCRDEKHEIETSSPSDGGSQSPQSSTGSKSAPKKSRKSVRFAEGNAGFSPRRPAPRPPRLTRVCANWPNRCDLCEVGEADWQGVASSAAPPKTPLNPSCHSRESPACMQKCKPKPQAVAGAEGRNLLNCLTERHRRYAKWLDEKYASTDIAGDLWAMMMAEGVNPKYASTDFADSFMAIFDAGATELATMVAEAKYQRNLAKWAPNELERKEAEAKYARLAAMCAPTAPKPAATDGLPLGPVTTRPATSTDLATPPSVAQPATFPAPVKMLTRTFAETRPNPFEYPATFCLRPGPSKDARASTDKFAAPPATKNDLPQAPTLLGDVRKFSLPARSKKGKEKAQPSPSEAQSKNSVSQSPTPSLAASISRIPPYLEAYQPFPIARRIHRPVTAREILEKNKNAKAKAKAQPSATENQTEKSTSPGPAPPTPSRPEPESDLAIACRKALQDFIIPHSQKEAEATASTPATMDMSGPLHASPARRSELQPEPEDGFEMISNELKEEQPVSTTNEADASTGTNTESMGPPAEYEYGNMEFPISGWQHVHRGSSDVSNQAMSDDGSVSEWQHVPTGSSGQSAQGMSDDGNVSDWSVV